MDSSRPTVDHATYIRERLRTYSKGLMLALRAADATKSGTLTVPQFQLVLRNFDIDEVPDRCVSTSSLAIFTCSNSHAFPFQRRRKGQHRNCLTLTEFLVCAGTCRR